MFDIDNQKTPAAPQAIESFFEPNANTFLSGSSYLWPHVVSDKQGNLHAVYYDTATEQIMYTASSSTEALGTRHIVIAPLEPMTKGRYPRIAVDDGGGVHVVWIKTWEHDPSDHPDIDEVHYASCLSSCLEGGPLPVWIVAPDPLLFHVPTQCDIVHPSIVAWGSGNNRTVAIAVEQQSGNPAKTALKVIQGNGSTWNEVKDIAADYEQGFAEKMVATPALAIDRVTKRLHAIWYTENGTNPAVILHYRSSLNNVWGPLVELQHDEGLGGNFVTNFEYELWDSWFANTYAITVDHEGTVHVAFPYEQTSGIQEPWYMQCSGSCDQRASWTDPDNLALLAAQCSGSAPPTTMNHSIRLASSADGKVYAVWRHLTALDGANASVEVYAAQYEGGVWRTPVLIQTAPFERSATNTSLYPPSKNLDQLDLVITRNGLPSVTWIRHPSDTVAGPVAAQRLDHIDANREYVLRVTQHSTLPRINGGCEQELTVHPNTGWYEQPLIRYDITLINNTDINLSIDIKVNTRDDEARTRVYAPFMDVAHTDPEYGTFLLDVEGQTSVTKVITVIAQPSIESDFNLTVESQVNNATFADDPQTVTKETVHMPLANIRPVAVVHGFMGSFYNFNAEYVLDPLTGVYNTLIKQLEFYGYEQGVSIIPITYQWWGSIGEDTTDPTDDVPGSLNSSAEAMAEQLAAWQTSINPPEYLRTDEFDAITHSAGGLVTRAYVDRENQAGRDADLHTVMFFGSPQQGSPAAYAAYEGLDTFMEGSTHNPTQPNRYIRNLLDAFARKNGCFSNPRVGPITIRNYVSTRDVYNYVHSRQCRFGPQPGMPLMRQVLPPHSATSGGAPKRYLFENGMPKLGDNNPALETLNSNADEFLDQIENNDGHVVSVFTSVIATVMSYEVEPITPTNRYVPRWSSHGIPVKNGNQWTDKAYLNDTNRKQYYNYAPEGDGTVPAWSANLANIPAVANHSAAASIHSTEEITTDIGHTEYFDKDESLQHAIAYLINFEMPQSERYPVTPPANKPFKLDSPVILLINRCPVHMLLVDNQGRRVGTGPDGTVYNEVPGAFYSGAAGNEPEIIQLPLDVASDYAITITGEEAEPYEVTRQLIDNNGITNLDAWTGVLQNGATRSDTMPAVDTLAPRRTLLIDHGQSASELQRYQAALATLDRQVDIWNIAQQGDPRLDDVYGYTSVMWAAGDQTTLSLTHTTLMHQYIEGGGGLILAGDNLSTQIEDSVALTSTFAVEPAATNVSATTIVGTGILRDLVFELNATSGPLTPDAWTLHPGAEGIAVYGTGATAPAAVVQVDSIGRLMVVGFGLDHLSTTEQATKLLWRSLTWVEHHDNTTFLPMARR